MDSDHQNDIELNIKRHANGCWTWIGSQLPCNIFRYVADRCGTPLPLGQKLFRMPECKLGKECVNPEHIGTGVDFILTVQGRRQEVPQLPMATGVKLTSEDREFLKSLKVVWD